MLRFEGDSSFREDRACDGDGPRDCDAEILLSLSLDVSTGRAHEVRGEQLRGKESCGESCVNERGSSVERERLPPMGDDSKGNERRTPVRVEKVAA